MVVDTILAEFECISYLLRDIACEAKSRPPHPLPQKKQTKDKHNWPIFSITTVVVGNFHSTVRTKKFVSILLTGMILELPFRPTHLLGHSSLVPLFISAKL